MAPIVIFQQNREWVLCQKPAGVLSQSGKPEEETMVTLLERQLGGEVYPVHRLDREVGGVMVYARTQTAAAALSRLVQQGTMTKEYLAVVRGCPERDAGVLEDLLFHDQRNNKSYVVKRERKGVKKARLSYRVLARAGEASLVQVRLFTGRTHQIRVQFASRGMPLLGDARYGGGSGKLALWSVRLRFPWKGERVCQVCLPEELGDFAELPGLAEME